MYIASPAHRIRVWFMRLGEVIVLCSMWIFLISGRPLMFNGSMELTKSYMVFSSLYGLSQINLHHKQHNQCRLRCHSEQAVQYTCTSLSLSLSVTHTHTHTHTHCRSVWARLEQTSSDLERMIQEQRIKLERCVLQYVHYHLAH